MILIENMNDVYARHFVLCVNLFHSLFSIYDRRLTFQINV